MQIGGLDRVNVSTQGLSISTQILSGLRSNPQYAFHDWQGKAQVRGYDSGGNQRCRMVVATESTLNHRGRVSMQDAGDPTKLCDLKSFRSSLTVLNRSKWSSSRKEGVDK